MSHPRTELRKRVEERQQQLKDALKHAESQKQETRSLGLQTELQVSEEALSGGWENVTEITANKLSSWLEATKSLVEAKLGKHDKGVHADTMTKGLPNRITTADEPQRKSTEGQSESETNPR